MKVFDEKCQQVLQRRSNWLVYLSFVEDKQLRKEEWNKKYEKHRPVFWDDINILFNYQPSGADQQRLTYLSYYGENCAKGDSMRSAMMTLSKVSTYHSSMASAKDATHAWQLGNVEDS
eukprot:1489459-Ditylum_brightwellii.AAC.1